MNLQDFEVANIFREIDPRGRVGWVLIVKGVSLICDIGWNKFELRNMENKNFEISECWNVFPALGNLLSAKGNDPKNVIYLKQGASRVSPTRRSKIRVAHGRPNWTAGSRLSGRVRGR